MKLLFACCMAGNPLLLLGQVQAVDLGLSVKWADRNLGSVENKHMNNTTGDYSFSWGELVDKYDNSTESVDGSTHGFEGYACDDFYTLQLISGILAGEIGILSVIHRWISHLRVTI